MTEEQAKALGKWLIDNYNRPLSREEKELLKQAIEQSKSWEQLIGVLMIMMSR